MKTHSLSSDFYDLIPAVLRGAWAASRVAGICFAAFFTLSLLIPPDTSKLAEYFANLLLSGIFWIAFVSALTLIVSVPATLVFGGAAYFFLSGSKRLTVRNFGLGGLIVGTVIFAPLVAAARPGQLVFGNPLSALMIGGIAGFTGARTFAKRMSLPD